MQETIHIQTSDGVLLASTFSRAEYAKACVVLLHMMPSNRQSWAGVQAELEAEQIASLAIDLRGHGESLKQGSRTLNYQEFDDEGHQASRIDVVTAITWLRNRGLERLGIMGASIGANLAIEAAASDPSLRAIALLSPGENFHGFRTEESAVALQVEQALLATASDDDDEDSFRAAKHIIELAPCTDKTFMPYVSAGHGTNLFLSDPLLPRNLARWFSERLNKI